MNLEARSLKLEYRIPPPPQKRKIKIATNGADETRLKK